MQLQIPARCCSCTSKDLFIDRTDHIYFIFQNNCLWRLSSWCLTLKTSMVISKKSHMCRRTNKGVGALASFSLLAEVPVFPQTLWDSPSGCFRALPLFCLYGLCRTQTVKCICNFTQLMSTYLFSSGCVCTLKCLCPHFLHPSWSHGSLPCADAAQFTSRLPSGMG